MLDRLAGLGLAFVGCILVFFTSSKVKNEISVILCLVGGSIAIGMGLKLMLGI
jgi:hypothetical protein